MSDDTSTVVTREFAIPLPAPGQEIEFPVLRPGETSAGSMPARPISNPPRKPHIFIATPCYGGQLHHTYVQSILKMLGQLGAHIDISISFLPSESLISRGRNFLFSQFIANDMFTHLVFVDSDIEFQPQALADLVLSDKAVCGCAYPIKKLNFARMRNLLAADKDITVDNLQSRSTNFVINPSSNFAVDARGFMKVDCLGTGFLSIRRDAAEQMVRAYANLEYKDDITEYAKVVSSSWDVFGCLIEPKSRRLLSEDYSFCHRYRAIGGEIFVNVKHELGHSAQYQYSGRLIDQLAEAVAVSRA